MKYYLAIDLGASSGRHIVGYLENGEIILKEIYRFKNEMKQSVDGLVWDIPHLFHEIKAGLKKVFEQYQNIESLSIDGWGLDYVLMDGDKEIPPYYAYRNERCIKSSQKAHEIIKFADIYQKTGIQFMPFNTIYQLYDDSLNGRLSHATDYLMIPSYFFYKLTGIKTHEYTNETTTGLLNAVTGKYDEEIIKQLGLPNHLFGEIIQPGNIVGNLLPEIQKEVGGNTKVILGTTHDTACAFESVNIDDDSIILSSGSWSLLGIKSKTPIITKESLKANYTNEGGVGYIRFLKNIVGSYLSNKLLEETNLSYKIVDSIIQTSQYKKVFDVNDPSLLAPQSMKKAILLLLKNNPPQNDIDLFASVYHSQASYYKKAVEELENITHKKYKKIYIIGGGAKNAFLDYLIKKYTGLKVIASQFEATSISNIMLQMKK